VEYKKNLPIPLSDAEKRRKAAVFMEIECGIPQNPTKKMAIL